MGVDILDTDMGGGVCTEVGNILQGGGVGHINLQIGDVDGDPLCRYGTEGSPEQIIPPADGKSTFEATLCKLVLPTPGGGGVFRSQDLSSLPIDRKSVV